MTERWTQFKKPSLIDRVKLWFHCLLNLHQEQIISYSSGGPWEIEVVFCGDCHPLITFDNWKEKLK